MFESNKRRGREQSKEVEGECVVLEQHLLRVDNSSLLGAHGVPSGDMNSEAFPAFLTQNKTNMLFSSGLYRFKKLIDLDTYCYD